MPDGSFFSVTGRGYSNHRRTGTGYDVNTLTWLLTGVGSPSGIKNASVFFATSSYSRSVGEDVLGHFEAPVRKWVIGASVAASLVELKASPNLTGLDFVPFMWSLGAYFHPKVIRHTFEFIDHTTRIPRCMNLWDHSNFRALRHLRFLTYPMLESCARYFKQLTQGSLLTEQVLM